MFGIVVEGQQVGHAQLALIDLTQRRAAVGIVIGKKQVCERGIRSTALRLLLDYAFTVHGLAPIYAESFGFFARFPIPSASQKCG